ncbi:MAG: hypothetical protein U5O39_07695 [Gammaproteobacteria bacterium]|nr:hypothetical protein [Gammaproteobacteria bacterium]
MGDWTLVGYGKAEGGAFAGDDALGKATLLAIRDGGARIAIDLPAEQAVVDWIEGIERNALDNASGTSPQEETHDSLGHNCRDSRIDAPRRRLRVVPDRAVTNSHYGYRFGRGAGTARTGQLQRSPDGGELYRLYRRCPVRRRSADPS